MIRKFEEEYGPSSPYFKIGRGEKSVFRNRSLSLKAIGLYCLIRSLPEKWDFNVAGLSVLTRDSPSGVKSGLKELEKAGYIRIDQVRKGGRFARNECLIFSSPWAEFTPAVKTPAEKTPAVKRQQEIKNKEIKKEEIKKEEDPPVPGRIYPEDRIIF